MTDKDPTKRNYNNQADRLRDALESALGMDWRGEVAVPARVDNIYWFVFLVEKGIAKAREEMEANKHVRPSEMVASVASWKMDLTDWVDRIILELSKPRPKGKRKVPDKPNT